MPCLAGTPPQVPWNSEVVHENFLEACSRHQVRVVAALAKRIDLNGNLFCQLIFPQSSRSLLLCSLDLLLAATFEFIFQLLLAHTVVHIE